MKRVTQISLVVGLVMVLVYVYDGLAKSPGKASFFSVLNGGQVVPPSTSNGMGVAFLTFDGATKQLCYSITYSGFQGTETEAHLHNGSVGETNVVLFDLNPLGSPKLGCVGPFTRAEENALKRGLMYINIHTDVFPAGEIRGQVLPARSVR